jgi:hypothetical protein
VAGLIVAALAFGCEGREAREEREAAEVQTDVRQAVTDMRSIAVALEAYFIDNNGYPPHIAGDQPGAFAHDHPAMANVFTFRVRVAGEFTQMLTTPLAYIDRFLPDPFNERAGSGPAPSFAYYTDCGREIPGERRLGAGWIVWSMGPDGDFDLTRENVEELYTSFIAQPSRELLTSGATYDPSNGLRSSGDVYRTRQ